jgi:hypothetical protein
MKEIVARFLVNASFCLHLYLSDEFTCKIKYACVLIGSFCVFRTEPGSPIVIPARGRRVLVRGKVVGVLAAVP